MTSPAAEASVSEPGDLGQHRRTVVNGVGLHYVEAGDGPLVVLLHGFPEFWYSWRHQIAALAGAGFRVLAPDLRGYNESDKPRGIRHYRIDVLIDDVVGLIRQTGAERAVVVGHDWGGGIAWMLAMARPDLVERLVILNSPHPAAFRRELKRPAQWLRSSYMLLFQLPWLPEKVIAFRDYALLERMLRRQPVHIGAFSRRDVQRYKDALAKPGALTASLNYYRALRRYQGDIARRLRPVAVPTLLIWGEKDPYLNVRLTEGLEPWVSPLQVVRIPDASHWVQNDKPEQVNQLIMSFLRSEMGN
jgi:pimeloyl-ACP methyl ester carboxylesterase